MDSAGLREDASGREDAQAMSQAAWVLKDLQENRCNWKEWAGRKRLGGPTEATSWRALQTRVLPPPTKFIHCNVISSMMVFGVGPWGGNTVVRVGFCPYKRAPRELPPTFHLRSPHVKQEEGPSETHIYRPLHLGLQPPELWGINFCCLWSCQSVALLEQPEQTKIQGREHES